MAFTPYLLVFSIARSRVVRNGGGNRVSMNGLRSAHVGRRRKSAEGEGQRMARLG